jgi:hypothetical protein
MDKSPRIASCTITFTKLLLTRHHEFMGEAASKIPLKTAAAAAAAHLQTAFEQGCC